MRDFIKGKLFIGKDPKGLCAGALYLISKLENRQMTQKEKSINPPQELNNKLRTFRNEMTSKV